jgi:hypothetical protein
MTCARQACMYLKPEISCIASPAGNMQSVLTSMFPSCQ